VFDKGKIKLILVVSRSLTLMARKFSEDKTSKTFVQSTFTQIPSCGDKCCETKASTNSFAVVNVVVVVVVRSSGYQLLKMRNRQWYASWCAKRILQSVSWI